MNIGKTTDIATTRSVGSKATSSALNKASSTAIGSSRAATAEKSVATIATKGKTAPVHPGSRAGMNDAKPAYLQGNHDGYMNKSNQTARYSAKTPMTRPTISSDRFQSKSTHKLFDSRLTSSKDSSISQLANRR